jgi:hypothetical protein
MENLDLESLSDEELQAEIDRLQGVVKPGSEVTTDTTEQPVEEQQTSTEDKFPNVKPGEIIPGTWGLRKPRPGIGGFFHDVGENMWQNAAPVVGLSDTLIDFVNFASADGGKYDIPKLPSYENKASQALRNISGLVIPSLGLRSMMMRAGSKIHAAKTAAPWLQRLGNNKTFEYFARGGIDFSSGGIVDYVAEQNQSNDTALTQIANFWPAPSNTPAKILNTPPSATLAKRI